MIQREGMKDHPPSFSSSRWDESVVFMEEMGSKKDEIT